MSIKDQTAMDGFSGNFSVDAYPTFRHLIYSILRSKRVKVLGKRRYQFKKKAILTHPDHLYSQTFKEGQTVIVDEGNQRFRLT